MRNLKRIVGEDFGFNDEESLEAYSRDSSVLKVKPEIVLLPENVEQLRRIIVTCNQQKIPISIRGNGSGTRGGCLGKGIIISMKRFTKILSLERDKKIVEVQAGVSINDLNKVLKKYNFEFSLKPGRKTTTIGSLIALNACTMESFGYGFPKNLIESITYIDGTGKYGSYQKKDFDKIIGLEGTTAIIISAKLKLKEINREEIVTLDVLPYEESMELIKKKNDLMKRKDIISIEYLNKKTSVLLGLKEKNHLLVFYNSEKGSYKDLSYINDIIKVRKNVDLILWEKDFKFVDDFKIPQNSFFELMKLANKLEIPCYAHLANGYFFVAYNSFKDYESSLIKTKLIDLYADIQGVSGYGLMKKNDDKELKSKLIMLKEKMDYNNLLNKGVILN